MIVTVETPFESCGKSNGYVAWALSVNVLSIDRAPEAEYVIMVEEANVPSKVVVEGLSKDTSGHEECLPALTDHCIDLWLLTTDVSLMSAANGI